MTAKPENPPASEELYARINKLEDFIAREGYRRCDIAACNCGSWHGGHAMNRLREIREALQDADVNTNGVTLLDAIRNALTERAKPNG